MKNILLLKGGGSTEHDISLLSANYIRSQVDPSLYKIVEVEIDKGFQWRYKGEHCELNFNRTLVCKNDRFEIAAAIPCIHGYPGETGDIQSFFELINLPYLGCRSETSVLCFNKLVTKLLLELNGVSTAPFIQINNANDLKSAENFLNEHKAVYIKATNQGSSVGCYRVDNEKDLRHKVEEAFKYSPYVILEKEIKGREIEVSAFEHNGEIHTTRPGEIDCSDEFYTYEAKYAEDSTTKTITEATGIDESTIKKISAHARKSFEVLKIRHLARIDFFLTPDNEVYLNEINTFPGHTKISMFPMMMENYGVKYSEFINQHLANLVEN